MKKLLVLLAAGMILALTAGAAQFDLIGAKKQSWSFPVEKIRSGCVGFNVTFNYVCHGRTQLFPWVQFFDASGKKLGKELLCRPPLHYPSPEYWEKQYPHTFCLDAIHFPENAAGVQVRLNAISTGKFAKENTSITVIDPKLNWEFRMMPENRLGFFDVTKPVCYSSPLPTGMTGVRGVVFNSDGKKVYSSDSSRGSWSFPAKQPGFYTVKFFWLDKAGKAIPASTALRINANGYHGGIIECAPQQSFPRDVQAFAVTAAPRRPRSEMPEGFGFNTFIPSRNSQSTTNMADSFTMAYVLGWDGFLRAHWFRWYLMEEKKDQYDWSSTDEYFKTAASFGIPQERIIANFMGTPRWNSPQGGIKNVIWTKGYYFFAPNDLEQWGKFIEAAVRRYPRVLGVELWNEPHLKGGSIFWQDSTTKRFVELMETGYQAVKRANPATPVVMGGIGMRYLPFYQEFVALDGNRFLDIHSSHCGYDMTAFYDVDRKHGEKVKPWWELEWHTVLYNCHAPTFPSEEECTLQMLVNLADLIFMGNQKIAAFGGFCGNHTPETARFWAKQPGIQQISGLFRSQPGIEPRLAACALRAASDRFSGKVKPLGAWSYPEQWQGVLFESKSGKVLFFWCDNEKGSGKLPKILAGALKKAKLIDWEGRQVAASGLRTRRLYFAENPDAALLAKGTKQTGPIAVSPKKPVLDRTFSGCYGSTAHQQKLEKFTSLKEKAKPTSGSFKADFSREGLKLTVTVKDPVHCAKSPNMQFWNYDSLQFAIDAVGSGFNEDALEFCAGNNEQIYKTKMPVLKGDIPAEYSTANCLLTKSTVKITRSGELTNYQVFVAASDLYPFIWNKDQKVRFSLLVNNNDGSGRSGYLHWGNGIGDTKNAAKYGTLTPCGGKVGKILIAPFQQAKVTEGNPLKVEAFGNGKGGSGVKFSVFKPVSGAHYTFEAEVRGSGRMEIMAHGNLLKRTNFRCGELSSQWKKLQGEITLPAGEKSLHLVFFFWRQPTAKAEIRNLKIESR